MRQIGNMSKWIKLHGADNRPTMVNIDHIVAVWIDEENRTRISDVTSIDGKGYIIKETYKKVVEMIEEGEM